MTSLASRRIKTPGQLVVLVLLLAGVVAGVISVRHWRAKARQQAQADAGPVQRDIPAIEAELAELQHRVQSALDDDRPHSVRHDVERFIQKYPRAAPGYTLLGQVLLGLKQLDKAYDQFDLSLQLDPAQGEVHLLAGSMCLHLGRIDDAERHYLQAVGLTVDNVEYRLHLAQCYIEQHRFDEARDQLMTAVYRDSSSHKGYAMLADLYMQQNKLVLAMGQIIKAIESTPLDERDQQVIYLRRKALILRRQHKPDEAMQVLSQLADAERGNPQVVEEMALCRSLQGRFADAAMLYESALRADPADWRFAAGAARWWIKAGDQAKARRAIAVVRSIDPHLPVLGELELMLHE